MTDAIESYWKEEAALFDQFYERGNNPFQNFVVGFLEARLRQMLPLFHANVKKGDRVIDVGCGSGLYPAMLLQMGASVTGVDYSEQMLKLARPRVAQFGDRATLVLGDARHLAAGDNCYDVAMAVGLLDYLPDTEAVVRELIRVVRPNGKLIVTIPKNPSPFWPMRTRLSNGLRRALFGLPPIVTAMTADQYRALLARLAVKVTHLEPVQQTMWIAVGEKAAG